MQIRKWSKSYPHIFYSMPLFARTLLVLLPNKTKQPKDTSMPYKNIKNKLFFNKLLGDTGHNTK